MPKKPHLYQVKATKGGESIMLYFIDYLVAYDAATALMGKGCVVSGPEWPTSIEHSTADALKTAGTFLKLEAGT